MLKVSTSPLGRVGSYHASCDDARGKCQEHSRSCVASGAICRNFIHDELDIGMPTCYMQAKWLKNSFVRFECAMCAQS